MTKILLSGCLGKMGTVITQAVLERDDCEIVAGIDHSTPKESLLYPVYDSFEKISESADVIIDFSNPAVLDSLLSYAEKNNIPAVIATTGLNEEQIKNIEKLSKKLPIFFTANMSLGVNLICELAKKAAKVLYPAYNIEIIEQHHNLKLDAPSGTALMIANEIASVLPDKVSYEYDRHSKRAKRPVDEIGIHSVRGGTIVGEHEVIFAGKDEIVKISHSAMSKEIFATGSINAAIYLKNQKPGLYSMKDMLDA